MGKIKIIAFLICCSVFVATLVSWQTPAKSYIVITSDKPYGKSVYTGTKGRVEYPTLQEAINNLSGYGYRITDVEMSGHADYLSVLTIMEK